ncbi:hypothetical protein AGDE_05830 [Angomonas deanei]|uniref:TFIIH basal transcription factor subunit n=1 Tax=Angomonas deanei TaxID=59799 RepID=A0A7G2C9X9_9TRYP|nr:hypothetical protein AGDE_05830 [Angomonas deanei]CAD2216359.1 hypothetical protein, conserved [Angomonas deanei]|eukprot:EPY38101.1 hypothetical protein AGDE_05830 [Angomonas deanei]
MNASEWDPSVPGAGAKRAVAISQLYFRLCKYHRLTILVTDVLALVFGADGGTVGELGRYLGLEDGKVEFALLSVPKEMLCTLSQLGEDHPYRQQNSNLTEEKNNPRYFLNYKGVLAVAYGHVCRILLLASLQRLPEKKEDQLNINISANLNRSESREGIKCPGCAFYFTLSDFDATVNKCPVCTCDIVQMILKQTKQHFDHQASLGLPLVTVLPKSRGLLVPRGEPANKAPAKSNDGAFPLAKDPYLAQQAIVFFYLYSSRFAFVNEGTYILDPDELLTEDEFEKRVQGKTSTVDSFRALHRNVSDIRVRVVHQSALEERRFRENEQKIKKRKNLPPWLRIQGAPDPSQEEGNEATPAPLLKRPRNEEAADDVYKKKAKFIIEERLSNEFEPVHLPSR